MLAVGYVRVSTGKQAEEGVSLDAQIERIRAYCTLAGLELASILREEAVSASIPLQDRPAGAKLLADLKAHKAQHVVALKLDRLFRDAADALNQTRLWDKAGIALHLVDVGGQTINTAAAMGRMFLTMMAGFAELERNLIAERTTNALRFKKRNGQVYSGNRPLGYAQEGDILVPDPAEQKIVGRIKTERMAGRSLRDIANGLNSEGIRGRKGGIFYAASIKAILENDIHGT
ncbi:recombinase family protein [Methylobacterium oryzae]|uniref:recombinase family protein n=1 Tax=Methylobacterium oryzae TaxID=334852 RepID=UPI002F2D90DC